MAKGRKHAQHQQISVNEKHVSLDRPIRQTPQNASSDDDVLDLGAMLRTLWRKKLWILASVILATALGAFYAYKVVVPKYRATSVVLLDTAQDQLVDLGAVLPSLGSESEAINTEVEVLKSRRLLERVVTAADLTQDPEFNGALRPLSFKARFKNFVTGATRPTPTQEQQVTGAVNALLARISVRNLPKTYILQITLETENAAKSAMLADTMAEQYILYQMDVKFEATRDASEWLTSRVADLQIELEQAEARLAEFSSNSEVVSIETVQALERQLKELRDRLQTMRASLVTDTEQLNALENAQDATPEEKIALAGDPRLETIFRENGAGPAFDARFRQILNLADIQVQRSQTQIEALMTSINAREADIARQSDELIQLQQLTREAEASRLLYEYFLSRLKETSAQEGIQRADSRILSNAVLPTFPSEPRKTLILAMSIMLGGLIGIAGVLLWEMRKNGYRLPEELEEDTGLPVMGQLPLLPTSNRREALEYLSMKPTSSAAEAVRNLRTSILLSSMDKTPKVIMLSSALPGEGKTTVSFALAQNFVGLGKKVLLIEGDIRRRVFSQYLDVKDAKGMMSVLSGETTLTDAAIHDPVLGADILISEQTDANAADILSSQQFKTFLETAREAYDIVIIDTPPVLVVPDARVVAQLVDTLLFTVHWDKTSKTQLANALRMFDTVGVRINGLVLNQIDPKGMREYGYGDSYGAYGAYGSKYYTN
ncbi:MAG: polysaccharide biosynthesis tyrosine autokinase [Rhodobacteraceae bacterium]|nr:polysaccharide biosynthesis tyrosine autokinase [Paracoccaceae bacterium]